MWSKEKPVLDHGDHMGHTLEILVLYPDVKKKKAISHL